MIELKHIHKSFGNKSVIKDVSAQFEASKCNLIIGALVPVVAGRRF
jgi:phospholipid/cholesterol/gamma-HCH transport system ATP-binding protein